MRLHITEAFRESGLFPAFLVLGILLGATACQEEKPKTASAVVENAADRPNDAGKQQKNAPYPRLAVLDVDLVYAESKLTKACMLYRETVNNKFREDFIAIQRQKGEKPDDAAFQADLQAKIDAMQRHIEMEQARTFALLREAFDDTIEAMRIELKLDVIVQKQAVLALDPSFDVTAAFLERFDSLSIDFATAQPRKLPEDYSAVAQDAPAGATGGTPDTPRAAQPNGQNSKPKGNTPAGK